MPAARDAKRLAPGTPRVTAPEQRPFNSISLESLRPLPRGRDEVPLLRIEPPAWTFSDLVLSPKLAVAIEHVLAELRNQSAIRAHGLNPRSHLLFVGPPGSGKTATAAAIASELGLPFVRVDLASLVSSYLGETAKNIAQIFEYSEGLRCVLLFDEVDAVAKERSDRSDHGELKRVVATFLHLLESQRTPSPVIAATNHPAMLDEALWRRFDEVLFFELPNQKQIRHLVEVKMRTMHHRLSLAETQRMRGFSQAEVELACHNAMRRAIVDNRELVTTADLHDAITEIGERRRRIRSSFRS